MDHWQCSHRRPHRRHLQWLKGIQTRWELCQHTVKLVLYSPYPLVPMHLAHDDNDDDG